jgi:hypothetical protein
MTVSRYTWIKVVNVGAMDEPRQVAAWSGGSAPAILLSLPPLPTPPDPGANPDKVLVYPTCSPCPNTADIRAPGAAITAPPAPTGAEGWQLDSCSAHAHGAMAPRMAFACHPIDGDRSDALTWIDGVDGKAWAQGAVACTLLSHHLADTSS